MVYDIVAKAESDFRHHIFQEARHHGIDCLTVHDAFIVKVSDLEAFQEIMDMPGFLYEVEYYESENEEEGPMEGALDMEWSMIWG